VYNQHIIRHSVSWVIERVINNLEKVQQWKIGNVSCLSAGQRFVLYAVWGMINNEILTWPNRQYRWTGAYVRSYLFIFLACKCFFPLNFAILCVCSSYYVPIHLLLIDLILAHYLVMKWDYDSPPQLCNFLPLPVTSSLLGPNILICTLSWNMLNILAISWPAVKGPLMWLNLPFFNAVFDALWAPCCDQFQQKLPPSNMPYWSS
jgi:hypothetical protein